ncbi:MAG TPA: RsmD family RNA methyltransferase [Candidatus Saccharimonadales bacterium]|nr:RsmD family RNA methyltransferase [Candidatus Saccharimonadales bacterium]
MKQPTEKILTLDKIVGGGQALGKLQDGKKVFVWGGLPYEKVRVQLTKNKSSMSEGIAIEVLEPSQERIAPIDSESYLSTSPWQIMTFDAEQHYKAALIEEAFELHDIVLPQPITVYTDGNQYKYRNKIEFSFWFDTETNKLSLAFFRRGTHGKIPVQHTSLAHPSINHTAEKIVATLNTLSIEGRALKTLLVRCNQQGKTAWQLYVKREDFPADEFLRHVGGLDNNIQGEVIYSHPKSPASVITKRLANTSTDTLSDIILGIPFRYRTESFFQINLPVYEQALRDMKSWVAKERPTVDLYSGVGTIGLTISEGAVTLVEVNEAAVQEMNENIRSLKRKDAKAVLAASEKALDSIQSNATIIVDPPRAGLHDAVIEKLLETTPQRIIYLSCNPVTQARDVARLAEKYGIRTHQGYNFFPRTPHIEHLVILDLKH